MNQNIPRFTGAVWLTMLIAEMFNNLPLSGEWMVWKPDWVALALLHWALILRQDSSLFMAFFMGLLTDVLSGSLLGQFALGYVMVAYISVRLGLRMTPDAYVQQFALVFIVIGLFMLVNLWISEILGQASGGLAYWGPLISSLVIWPFYHWFLSYFYTPRKVA
ncbi:MAG: Rod shape-determining protein MreD [uncultured Thiotrichaceae bacterium]|uniref:Rod shape-determining protein MreD n=1 Tax=uncultured Thiotrichaceae bacterium TaxID=298394 RepID=A0A6S6T6Y7_9GAMM|nr:MAG: Rod shape-determining protein MreD [uncultured Thiotrichaceae bacterium]